jgi:hypothetical protein
MADQVLNITSQTLAALAALRGEAKFHAHDFYPGAPTEADRLDAERTVNEMLDRIAAGLPKLPSKAFVLSEFQTMLDGFDSPETEEREEICGYCERVMSVMGIERSDGLLNRWLYGFEPKIKNP